MTGNDGVLVRSVAWTELCPWLNVFRCFRLAADFRALALGAAGVVLMMSAWAIWAKVFDVDDATAAWMAPHNGCSWLAITAAVPDQPVPPALPNPIAAESAGNAAWHTPDPVFGVWAQLGRPLWAVFDTGTGVRRLACLLLCGLSSLAIWAFFGGAIARIAAVQLACEERVGIVAALRFACNKWVSYFVAPVVPIVGILFLAVPAWIVGLLAQWGFGALLGGLAWPVLLLLGFVIAALLVGLVFGWPLMWGTISAEGTDSFDGLSRSFAYVFQRPAHYLFYALVAAVFGVLGWLLVQLFASCVVGATYWAVSWGCGDERIALLTPGGNAEGLSYAGALLIRFWSGCVKLLAVGFLYSYFWTAATAIYFLLRRDVDATEMDEVYLDADATETAPPLIKTDAEGAPVVEEPTPPSPPAN
jgi:hypothetical protein